MQAFTKLSQSGASRMMVVDNGKLVGLLSLKDLMKFIALKVELEDDNIATPRGVTTQESSLGRDSLPEEQPVLPGS